MDCTPSTLAKNAACFAGMPSNVMRSEEIYLLCRWLQQKASASLSYFPPDMLVTWIDSNGTHTGDLAFFNQNAYKQTVSSVTIASQVIVSVSGLSGLPALTTVNFSDTPITALDISNCPLLSSVDISSTSLTSFDALSSTSLVNLWCNGANLTSINVTGCQNLQNLDVGNCNLTTLNISGCPSITGLDCYSNPSLVSVYISSSTALAAMNAQNCKLSVNAVNDILDSIAQNSVTGGALTLNGQTPAAPPSVGPPDGIAAKANLMARVPPWTIFTD